jgi:hypothetical protein
MSCNCRIFPFKPDPPCFDLCTGRLLNSIAERVLRHLNVPHIDKVIQFRRQQWIDDLKELSTVTSKDRCSSRPGKWMTFEGHSATLLLGRPSSSCHKPSANLLDAFCNS